MSRPILIISGEALGEAMSGPAIRYWELAHALAAAGLSVTLAAPAPLARASAQVALVAYEREGGAALRDQARQCQACLLSGFSLYRYPFLRALPVPLIVDLYDPFVLENLEIHAAEPLAAQAGTHRINLAVLQDLARRGDFFLCASDRQRDFWLGLLMAAGRINPYTFRADRTLQQLIAIVPFGLPDEPPRRQPAALKGVWPGIAPGDQVVYWGGGLWEWFDPLTAVRAMAAIAARRSDVKLVFAGVRHPNPEVPAVRMAAQAQQLSADLGLTGRSVFFGEWVPYAQRVAYLLEAEVGLSLHFDHIETRFAYRTRLLDYIWAGLPMVVTQGDVLGDQAQAAGLARAVPPEDPAAVAAALLALLAGGGRAWVRGRGQALADDLRWSRVAAPLIDYCRQPARAADARVGTGSWHLPPHWGSKVLQSLRARGVRGLWRDVWLYWKR